MQIHKKWSEFELTELKKDYGVLSPIELENKYKRSYLAIRSTASRYGMKSNARTDKRRKWTKKEESELSYYWENTLLTSKELAVKFDRSIESIRNKVKDLRLQKKELYVSEEEEQKIINLYNSKKDNGSSIGSNYIAKEIGRSQTAVLRVLEKNDIKKHRLGECSRIYTINEKYYDNGICSCESAYIAGLLYSDGTNSEQKGQVAITLQKQDAYLLQNVAKVMRSNSPIRIRKQKYKDQEKEYAHLLLANRHLSNAIASIGIVQNKSLIAQPPKIFDKRMFMSFLRGMSDGDGSITVQRSENSKRIEWDLCGGAKDLMDWIYAKLSDFFPYINFRYEQRKKNLYNIAITSSRNAILFFNELYRDVWEDKSNLFLRRKIDKIAEWRKFRILYEYENGDFSKPIKGRKKIISGLLRLGILQQK